MSERKMTERLCSNCKYWGIWRIMSPTWEFATEEIRHRCCHRYPPLASLKDPTNSFYPPTDKNDWCGEWAQAEKG
jgi:hypothetical protein